MNHLLYEIKEHKMMKQKAGNEVMGMTNDESRAEKSGGRKQHERSNFGRE